MDVAITSARELAADRRLRRALNAYGPRPLPNGMVIDDDRPRAYVSSGAVALLGLTGLPTPTLIRRMRPRPRS